MNREETKKMKRKKLTALVLSLALAVTGTMTGFSANNAKAADYGLSNPRVDSEGNVTWDCAYFGSYNQTAQWEKEPIRWRVLSVDENNNAFIVADKILDSKRYNETLYYGKWEKSTIRSWLNGYGADANECNIDYSTDNFIDEAFTEEEQEAINVSTVINNDNPTYGTEGGNDTEDKIYLLSLEEVSNVAYGFDSTFDDRSETREVKNTDYAKVNNANTNSSSSYAGNGYWCLRSPGKSFQHVCRVSYSGTGDNFGGNPYIYYHGIRPALHINLSSSSVWTDAGVTDSEGNDGASEDNIINNPVVENGVTKWDCIYFGSYNQTVKEWNKEPIKWRVLSVDGNDAFFVADKNLDCKSYNETLDDVTWETCTLRSWLNGYGADSNGNGVDYATDNFIDEAFTEEEQAAINTTTVINNDNPSYGTDGGNNTEDKVYLLSIEEATDAEYGFDSEFDVTSKTREVKNTDYAKINGVLGGCSIYDECGYWWLRSPGRHLMNASHLTESGWGFYSQYVDGDNYGIRPVLHIDMSSSVWENAGTVTSVMTNYGEQYTPSPIPIPTSNPTVSPSASPVPQVTDKPSDGTEPTENPTVTEAPTITAEPEGETTPTTVPDANNQPTEQPVTQPSPQPTQAPAVTPTIAPFQTVAPTDTPKADEEDSKTDKVKTFKLSSLKIKKNATKITGKVSVSKATVKIKVGSKAWKKATVKGKKFTLKTAKLKKNTKIQIKVSKKGYKTLKKYFKVK